MKTALLKKYYTQRAFKYFFKLNDYKISVQAYKFHDVFEYNLADIIITYYMEEGDKQFISQEVMKIMDDSVNNLFGIREEHAEKDHKANYNKEKANINVNNLIDFVIRGLCKLNKPFKYSVTGLIMQNNGAGLNTCSMAYNDPNNDGAVTIQRQVGDNIVVLTIFAMQI